MTNWQADKLPQRPLEGQVALVTGASRGVGRGTAVELAAAGALVYITCRPVSRGQNRKDGGDIVDVAKEVNSRGGKCVIAYCDHSDPEQVERLFQRISRENNGQLDILINNAYSAVEFIMKNSLVKFYDYKQRPENVFDLSVNVGLRNAYICATYAAKMMAKRKRGVIINMSSIGGLIQLFDVSYSITKAGLDKMSSDMAIDLLEDNVTVISLHPGPIKTETISDVVLTKENENKAQKDLFSIGESIYLTGRIIVRLLQDANLLSKTGKIIPNAVLAAEYGVIDVDDRPIPNIYPQDWLDFLNKQYEIRMGDKAVRDEPAKL
ncbi:unnamed protein product [Bursaphelenchus xylophilus]|uniref:(pine wood nematode) hypothetical protein n=1 Tax=Bursaphelenchus xylophilus TaxID=6326 RepID=A0A1I7RW45_BURXY|nr:unnamed protein product [Bursaphelenchus xylophilus]CAG9095109.1 unnamed protein product [Bursaphelenchus xylophilus]